MNKQTQTHRHRQQYGYQRAGGWEEVEKDKGGQIYGNERRVDFGW